MIQKNVCYIAVSWVSMQVSTSSQQSFQSFWPASESVSSLARGGVDADETIESVVVALNIREAPRKQTTWSCLGDALIIVGDAPLAGAKKRIHFAVSSGRNCREWIAWHLDTSLDERFESSQDAETHWYLPRDRLLRKYSVYELRMVDENKIFLIYSLKILFPTAITNSALGWTNWNESYKWYS